MEVNIKDLVKSPNMVNFNRFRAGIFYYRVYNPNETPNGETYEFQVPIEDIGEATLEAFDKAITYMRWIRKAIQNNTLVKIR